MNGLGRFFIGIHTVKHGDLANSLDQFSPRPFTEGLANCFPPIFVRADFDFYQFMAVQCALGFR